MDDLIFSLHAPDVFSVLRTADVIAQAGLTAAPGLVGLVLTGTNQRARAVAIDILGEMRALDAADAVAEALRKGDVQVRVAACRALGRFETPDAVDLLAEALLDEAWPVQAQAAKALGLIGDSVAVPLIRPLLTSAYPWVAYNAAAALAALGPDGLDCLRITLAEVRASTPAGDPEPPCCRFLSEVLAPAGGEVKAS